MIDKEIIIDGMPVKFRASAAVPRLYRNRFRRDIMADLKKLSEAYQQNVQEGDSFDVPSLEVFENVAYTMAKHADPGIPNTAEEWLEGFQTFSIYQILPDILELWVINMETLVDSKKNLMAVVGK